MSNPDSANEETMEAPPQKQIPYILTRRQLLTDLAVLSGLTVLNVGLHVRGPFRQAPQPGWPDHFSQKELEALDIIYPLSETQRSLDAFLGGYENQTPSAEDMNAYDLRHFGYYRSSPYAAASALVQQSCTMTLAGFMRYSYNRLSYEAEKVTGQYVFGEGGNDWSARATRAAHRVPMPDGLSSKTYKVEQALPLLEDIYQFTPDITPQRILSMLGISYTVSDTGELKITNPEPMINMPLVMEQWNASLQANWKKEAEKRTKNGQPLEQRLFELTDYASSVHVQKTQLDRDRPNYLGSDSAKLRDEWKTRSAAEIEYEIERLLFWEKHLSIITAKQREWDGSNPELGKALRNVMLTAKRLRQYEETPALLRQDAGMLTGNGFFHALNAMHEAQRYLYKVSGNGFPPDAPIQTYFERLLKNPQNLMYEWAKLAPIYNMVFEYANDPTLKPDTNQLKDFARYAIRNPRQALVRMAQERVKLDPGLKTTTSERPPHTPEDARWAESVKPAALRDQSRVTKS